MRGKSGSEWNFHRALCEREKTDLIVPFLGFTGRPDHDQAIDNSTYGMGLLDQQQSSNR